MTRIASAFDHGKAFIGFVTAGDPSLEASEAYILAMIQAGADLIEIGIPFSDPIAEGPVIQAADLRALSGGTRVRDVLALAARLRQQTQVPLVFLSYLNPIFHYGYEAFFASCEQAGVDGIIIPDLPFAEKAEVASTAAAHNVDLISLVAPTSQQRIAQIAAEASGFIYLVSSLGVTGVRSQITTNLASIVETIRAVTNTPIAIGFGVHSPQQAQELGALADGVIVGSAIVQQIANSPSTAVQDLTSYVQAMKAALARAEISAA